MTEGLVPLSLQFLGALLEGRARPADCSSSVSRALIRFAVACCRESSSCRNASSLASARPFSSSVSESFSSAALRWAVNCLDHMGRVGVHFRNDSVEQSSAEGIVPNPIGSE